MISRNSGFAKMVLSTDSDGSHGTRGGGIEDVGCVFIITVDVGVDFWTYGTYGTYGTYPGVTLGPSGMAVDGRC